MLNIIITRRRKSEDYIAVQKNTGILPISGRHFIGVITVCAVSIICALPFGELMPLSIETSPYISMLNKGVGTDTEQSYLQNDEDSSKSVELSADAGSRENYNDTDLPSTYFSPQALAEAILGGEAVEQNNTSDNSSISAAPTIRERFVASSDQDPLSRSEKEKQIQNGTAEIAQNQSALASTSDLASQLPRIGPESSGSNVRIPLKESLSEKAQETLSALQSDNVPVLSGLQSFDNSSDIETPRPNGDWYKQTVHKGDNISAIFNYLSLPNGTLAQINKVASKKDLALSVGTQIHFLIDKKNNVLEMVKPLDKNEQVRFTRMTPKDEFTAIHEPINAHVESKKEIKAFAEAEKMPNALEAAKERAKAQEDARVQAAKDAQLARENAKTRPRLVMATLQKGETFKQAAKRIGLTNANISAISTSLRGKVNTNKLAGGDSFRVLFNGIGTNSTISAIEFNTARDGKLSMYRHPDNGTLYEEDGYKPTAGVFRRFPVNTRLEVSSPFNPRRMNPVRHRVSPHNGVDFRMPIGTPVYAPSDGIVTYAGYMRGGGYTVIVKHMGAYSTVYMHLSRINVSKGQNVRLGQMIAKSGNTGGSTGPHLHYEIRINDRPVDPLKVDLPAGSKDLANERRQKFQSTVKVLKSDLYKESLALRKE